MKIKKSELTELIRHIVENIVREIKVDEESGAAAVSPVSMPMGKKKEEETIDEDTTTSAVSGYNIPGAFASKGGSKKGIAGSAALGYELTNQGKKDMSRPADKIYEGKK